MTEETATVARLDYSKPPPGYTLTESCGWWPADGKDELVRDDESYDTEADALAAAWAHYKAHNDPSEVVAVVRYMPPIPWWAYPGQLDDVARSAAWAWHDRRLALCRTLDNGVWCPECGSDEAHIEAIDDKTCTQPWCTECDVEMGSMFDDLWPRCLTWTDDQAAEVERWLRDSTAEMPAVLQSDDDTEWLIGGPDDVGRVGAATHIDDGERS